jgi:hypothetical protein
MSFRYDAGQVQRFERTPEGFLRVYATVSRVGELKYRNADGSERIEVLSREELFRKDSLDSASMKPITLLHPPEPVTPGNAKDYMVGMNSHRLIQDGDFLQVVATITHQDAIAAIENGTREMSAGYSVTVEQRTDGKYEQRDRRYNHFAIVPRGRAGGDVRIHMDADDFAWQVEREPSPEKLSEDARPMALISVGKRNYNVDGDDAPRLADAVAKLHDRIDELESQASTLGSEKSAAEDKLTAAQEELTTTKATLETAQGELEGTKAKLDAAENTRTDADAIASEVQARLDIWSQVLPAFRADNAEFAPDYSKSVAQVKRDYLSHANPELKLDGKSDEFVEGLWEAMKPSDRVDHTKSLRTAIDNSTTQRDDGYMNANTRKRRERALPGMAK